MRCMACPRRWELPMDYGDIPPAVAEWLDPTTDPEWSWLDDKGGNGLYDITDGGDRFLVGMGDGAGVAQAQIRPRSGNSNWANVIPISDSAIGHQFPRLAPKPDRSLDYRYGNALCNWATEILEIDLLPWQEFVLREGCARRNNRFRYRTILVVVARQNGKTLLSGIRALGGMALFGEKQILGAAQNRRMSADTWRTCMDFAIGAGLLEGNPRYQNGQEEFRMNGSRYRIAASSAGAARGMSGIDLLILDEIRQMRTWEGYGALEKTRRARPDSQCWALSTEGDLESVVLNKLQDQARLAGELNQEMPLGYFEWSAPPGDDPGSPRTWAYSNPSLGYMLDPEVVRAEFQTDPSEIFEVEVLCRKVSLIQSWVDIREWEACRSSERFPIEEPFVVAMDAVPELRSVSLVAAAYVRGRHHVELIDQFSGPAALQSAQDRLDSLLRRWKPSSVVTLAKGPCEAAASEIAASHGIPHVAVRPTDWARACRSFFAAVTKRTVSHPGANAIANALKVTKRGPDGLVSSLHRINVGVNNEAAIAAVLALWQSTQIPEPMPVPNWTAY